MWAVFFLDERRMNLGSTSTLDDELIVKDGEIVPKEMRAAGR
jgi:hypothetical protein